MLTRVSDRHGLGVSDRTFAEALIWEQIVNGRPAQTSYVWQTSTNGWMDADRSWGAVELESQRLTLTLIAHRQTKLQNSCETTPISCSSFRVWLENIKRWRPRGCLWKSWLMTSALLRWNRPNLSTSRQPSPIASTSCRSHPWRSLVGRRFDPLC